MKKYLSLFKMKFCTQLQYRGAALAGMSTQFFWGVMEILTYRAFYESNPSAFPMTMSALVDYIWLQQAFLAFFQAFFLENDIFDMIQTGDIVYELCRPIHIYDLWFFRSLSHRLSCGLMRCVPILTIAVILPNPYGLSYHQSPVIFLWFLLAMLLGLICAIGLGMVLYMLSFFTISAQGLRMCSYCIFEFFGGAVIPLPFFPDWLQKIVKFLPYASIQNVPLRIFGGNLKGTAMYEAVGMQVFWCIALIIIGRGLGFLAMKKVIVQGG